MSETATIVEVPPDGKPKIPKAHLTVNRTAVYQPTFQQAEEACSHREGSFVRMLDTDEQVYRRTVTVNHDWQMVDFGWVEGTPTYVFLINKEQEPPGGIPTPEVKAAVMAKVIEIGGSETIGVPSITRLTRARVYESAQFDPIPGVTYYVRCLNGPAKMTIVAVPGDGS